MGDAFPTVHFHASQVGDSGCKAKQCTMHIHAMRLTAHSTALWTTTPHQWRLLRGEQLIIMAGTEQMEWHQTPGNHVGCIGHHSTDFAPAITTSPIKAPPTSCACKIGLLFCIISFTIYSHIRASLGYLPMGPHMSMKYQNSIHAFSTAAIGSLCSWVISSPEENTPVEKMM